MKDEDVDKEYHILPMPPIPAEAWKLLEQAQKEAEVITGTTPSAKNVAAELLRQQDPANWSEEIWAAHDADLCELRNHPGKYCTEVHPDGPYEGNNRRRA